MHADPAELAGQLPASNLGIPASSPKSCKSTHCAPLGAFANRSSGPARYNPRARTDATMSTFKEKLYALCAEVASEFEGWRFSSGQFKNSSLKHSTLVIGLGFHIALGYTPLQPAIFIEHKRTMRLFKKIIGFEQPTSIVVFQNIPHLLSHAAEELRLHAAIFADKALQMRLAPPKDGGKSIVDVKDAAQPLRDAVMDGINLIEQLYDFRSEDDFLRGLPPKYTTRSPTIPYDEFERTKGVMFCIVRMLVGDFDFIEKYVGDGYQTIFPKRIDHLDKLMEALPELKRRYTATGKIG
jgi:hypothetical protein